MTEPSGQLNRGWKMPTEKMQSSSATDPTPGTTAVNSLDIEMGVARRLVGVDPNTRPKCFRNLFEEIVFVFTAMMATASTTLIQGAIIINTGSIGRELNMSSAEIAWIAASIGLTSGSFVLLFGKTADLFGGKIQIIFGMILLSLASLIIFLASGPISILVLCGFLGMGTAMIGPPAIGILLETYPEGQRRNRVTGALGAGNPLGFVIGSISSGLATKYWDRRSSFLVMAIFFLVMTTFVVWTVPNTPRAGDRKTIVERFDYLGAVFMIVGTALVSAGLTEGPNLGWSSFKVLLMLVIGAFCIAGFGIWETISSSPLLDPGIWKNSTFTLCVFSVSLGYMSFFNTNFWVALYMQNVQHFAPLHVAIALMPQATAGIFWSYLGQSLISKINGRLIMAIGGLAYLIGAILVVFIKEDSSYWMFLFPAMVLSVIGADFQFIVSNLYVNKQMPEQSSLAAGVLQAGRSLSMTVGLAISFAVYGSMEQTWAARSDQTYAYRYVYICSICFAVVSLLFIPFMRIEKQGNAPVSIASSNISSKTELNEAFEKTQTDGAQDQMVNEKQSEMICIPAQRSIRGSVSSAATAGSFDSHLPRWSWEQMRRWPDDRNTFEADNVVYEVCIKCSQERRVLVQQDRQEYNCSMDEKPEVLWDVEAQQEQGHSGVNMPALQEHSYLSQNRESGSGLTEDMVPSIVELRRLSTNPYRKSLQSWNSETLGHRLTLDRLNRPTSTEDSQQSLSSNPYRRISPEFRTDSPAAGERVLFNGFPTPNTLQSDQRPPSNNPYRLSLNDTIPIPGIPASLFSTQLPLSLRGGRIWINRTSSQTLDPQRHTESFREDTSVEFPPDISSSTPKRQEPSRSATLPLSPIKGRGFMDVELESNQESSGLVSSVGIATPPSTSTRVLNSREMAREYEARPVGRREKEKRWGSGSGSGRSVVNAGGYEQGVVGS